MIFAVVAIGITGVVISLLLTKKMFNPVSLYNITWVVISVLSKINICSIYDVSDAVYFIVFIGIVFFDLGYILSSFTLKKKKIMRTLSENNLDYNKVKNALIAIQILLILLTIPMVSKAIQYIYSSGFAYLRFIYSSSTDEYMSMFQKMFYIQYFVFPLAYATQLLALILFMIGRFKLRHIIPTLVLLALITMITAGRLVIFQFLFQLLALFIVIRRYRNEAGKRLKIKGRYKLLILIPIILISLVFLTSYRTGKVSAAEQIYKTIIVYFTGSFTTLTAALDSPDRFGLNGQKLFGLGYIGGLVDPFLTFLRLFGTRIELVSDRINRFTDVYLHIGNNQFMNAFFTSFYVYMKDFGIAGISFLSLLFGLLVGKTELSYNRRNDYLSLSIHVVALFCVFFSILRWEPYLIPFWTKLFYVIILNKLLLNSKVSHKSSKENQYESTVGC